MRRQSKEVINMKKLLSALIILSFLGTGLSFTLSAKEAKEPKKFFAAASYNNLLPADENFKEIYGSQHFYPTLKAGFFLSQKIYLWGGYGFFSSKGEIDVYGIKMAAKSKQAFISFGAGYRGSLAKKIDYRVETGAVSYKYEEETMGETNSQSSYGFKIDLGICYNFSRIFFGEIFAGYMYGRKELDARTIKIGGKTTGIGLGIRF
jgi:hypothetical protein